MGVTMARSISATGERLAIEGKLPHMLGRWRLVSVFGLLIWVALPIGFVSVFAFFL